MCHLIAGCLKQLKPISVPLIQVLASVVDPDISRNMASYG